jgi:hypothetical protein
VTDRERKQVEQEKEPERKRPEQEIKDLHPQEHDADGVKGGKAWLPSNFKVQINNLGGCN